MGLDMYLSKKTYVKNWRHMSPEELHKITVKKGGKVRKDIKPERISYIVEEVGYWRKFNALHNWFVENCQGGVDECQVSDVSFENLQELLEVLKKVQSLKPKDGEVTINEEKLAELLPTSSGFFFGSTDYDEYYFEEIDRTIELLEELVKEGEGEEFYYQASW